MNLPIILHLVRSDWQRLKRPLICLWPLLFLTALPWTLHDPGNFQPPIWTGGGWNGRLGPIPDDFAAPSWSAVLLPFSEMLATILALILAAMLGAQWAKHSVTPIRSRERLAAPALSLLVFVVLPQWILAFGNLLLHGFPTDIAALAAGTPALSAWFLLGLAAALGAWLPSPWLFLAGCAALASSIGFISELYRPLNFIFRSQLTLSALPAGLKPWLFGALAIALLAILFPFFRRRLNGPWKIAVAVVLILIAGIPAALLPPPDLRVKADPAIHTGAIHPVLRDVSMSMKDDSKSPAIQLFAEINPIGCPPDCGVRFVPADAWISQDGKRVAVLRHDEDSQPTILDSDGHFQPVAYGDDTNPAVLAALPGGGKPMAAATRLRTNREWLGNFELLPGATLPPDRAAELHVEFTAVVYRFEKVWDIPLQDEVTKFREGNLTWRIRRNSSQEGEPRADIVATYPAPAQTPSYNSGDIRSYAPLVFNSWLYFHLPATGTNVRATDRLMSASAPLFSGAAWDRAIIAPSNMFRGPADLTGLRLLRLKPVVLAKFTSSTVTHFRPWASAESSDYALTHRGSVNETTYRRDFFPKRPDPQTCTREEFARWLRIPASMFSPTSGAAQDLSQYAPRFAGLMAKVGNHESVAAPLRLGTPESMRGEVIGKIDSVANPNRLADVAMDRGWLDEARRSILRRFNNDELSETNPVMALEDPSTYPKLISRFLEEPERETYEKLRMLPGIEPLLGDAITKAARETSIEFLKANLASYQNSAPYGPFLYAAKRGDAAALDIVLDLYQASGAKAKFEPNRDLGYVLSVPELPGKRYQAVASWLRDKSAASFRFDPLLRLWKPLP